MNTAYQQASPPHEMHRGPIPDVGYRGGAPGGPQYPMQPQHSMPLPQQSQIPHSYGDPYNSLAVSRAPIAELVHGEAGLAPLQPGTQPAAADPLPRSCIENGWKYE